MLLPERVSTTYSYQTGASPRPEKDPHTADLQVDIRALEKNLERLLARP